MAFDTARDCQGALDLDQKEGERMKRLFPDKPGDWMAHFLAQCVATDDPRLKGK